MRCLALLAILASGCTLEITRDHLRVSILRDNNSQRTTLTTATGERLTVRNSATTVNAAAVKAVTAGVGAAVLRSVGL